MIKIMSMRQLQVGKILEAVVQGLEEDGSVHLPVGEQLFSLWELSLSRSR